MTRHPHSIEVQPVRALAVSLIALASAYLAAAALALGAAWAIAGRVYLPGEAYDSLHDFEWPAGMHLRWQWVDVFFLLLPLVIVAYGAAGLLQLVAVRPAGASRWLLIGGVVLAGTAFGVSLVVGPALQHL